MDKPRELEAKVGRIRLATRDTYDRRAMTALPSATGGRPSTAAPLAAAGGEEIAPGPAQIPVDTAHQPLGGMDSLFKEGRLRYARRPQGFLSTVNRLNRSLEEYTINNQDMVDITASYFEKLATHRPGILDGFDSPYEAAQWAVAHIQRSFEPGSAPRMVEMIHQSRAGRQVYQFLRRVEEAQNVES